MKKMKKRINNDIRDYILKKALVKLGKIKDAKLKRLQTEMEKCVNSLHSKKEHSLIDSLPSGWLPSTSYIYFRLPNMVDRGVFNFNKREFSRSRESQKNITLKKPFVHPCNKYPRNVEPNDKVKKAYFDYHEAMDNYHNTASQIWDRLRYINTMDKLIESWTDAKKYIKGYEPEITTELVIKFDDIDQALRGEKAN